jgi:recombination protein RecR
MDSVIPKSLQDAIDALEQLPGVGPRSAERYAYYLLKAADIKSQILADALKNLHKNIKYCPKTFALIEADQEVSPLYSDPKRDKAVIAVVADPFDIVALEKTHSFNGTYHVLGGLVSPIDNIGPDQLHIN